MNMTYVFPKESIIQQNINAKFLYNDWMSEKLRKISHILANTIQDEYSINFHVKQIFSNEEVIMVMIDVNSMIESLKELAVGQLIPDNAVDDDNTYKFPDKQAISQVLNNKGLSEHVINKLASNLQNSERFKLGVILHVQLTMWCDHYDRSLFIAETLLRCTNTK